MCGSAGQVSDMRGNRDIKLDKAGDQYILRMRGLTPADIAAVFCSDIHLQPQPPRARAVGDWWATQARALRQVRQVVEACGAALFVVGDVFDRWYSNAETINFALKELPWACYAVPGQHDLPAHDYAAVGRSAYGTLVAAGHVKDMVPGVPVRLTGPAGQRVDVYGHRWGVPLQQPPATPGVLQVACLHEYAYIKGTGHVGASAGALVTSKAKAKQYKGWHAVLYGDNHTPWQAIVNGTQVWGCGTLLRRTLADLHHPCRVVVLTWDGDMLAVPLLQGGEQWAEVDVAGVEVQAVDMGTLVARLQALGTCGISWRGAVEAFMAANKTTKQVQALVSTYLEAGDGR